MSKSRFARFYKFLCNRCEYGVRDVPNGNDCVSKDCEDCKKFQKKRRECKCDLEPSNLEIRMNKCIHFEERKNK